MSFFGYSCRVGIFTPSDFVTNSYGESLPNSKDKEFKLKMLGPLCNEAVNDKSEDRCQNSLLQFTETKINMHR